MVNCPVCSAEINEDFGLVTCASCGTPVLIELDGGAQIGNSAPAESGAASAPAEIPPPPPADDFVAGVPDPLENMPPMGEPPPIADLQSFDAPPAATPPMKPATSDMGEIADFGNAEVSQGKEGTLRFNVFISGIDSAEVRQNLLDTIGDQKLALNQDELMNQMKRGELKLEGLSSVKCALIVQRLRWLPLEIRWEQYGIHQI